MIGLRDHIRDALRASPTIYSWIASRNEHPDFDRRVARRGDDAVIDGYPRSGNTFATMAFRTAQPAPLKIGNHGHAPAQFLLALRYGVPAMAVVRAPKDAALSYCVYRGGSLTAERALEMYLAFYRPLLKIPQGWTPALFDEITQNFGPAIARMNRQFGTDFTLYQNDPARDAMVQDLINQRHARQNAKHAEMLAKRGNLSDSAARQTTPSAAKEALKPQYEAGFASQRAQQLLKQAQECYHAILQHPSLRGQG